MYTQENVIVTSEQQSSGTKCKVDQSALCSPQTWQRKLYEVIWHGQCVRFQHAGPYAEHNTVSSVRPSKRQLIDNARQCNTVNIQSV